LPSLQETSARRDERLLRSDLTALADRDNDEHAAT
jgi:hypothetical protein